MVTNSASRTRRRRPLPRACGPAPLRVGREMPTCWSWKTPCCAKRRSPFSVRRATSSSRPPTEPMRWSCQGEGGIDVLLLDLRLPRVDGASCSRSSAVADGSGDLGFRVSRRGRDAPPFRVGVLRLPSQARSPHGLMAATAAAADHALSIRDTRVRGHRRPEAIGARTSESTRLQSGRRAQHGDNSPRSDRSDRGVRDPT